MTTTPNRRQRRKCEREDRIYQALDLARDARSHLLHSVSLLGEPGDVVRAKTNLRAALKVLEVKS